MSPEDFGNAYRSKMHAVQSSVLFDIETNGANGAAADSKHLRTGLNAVMTDVGSLLKLLLDKGFITEDEMHKAILDGLDREIKRYEAMFPGFSFA